MLIVRDQHEPFRVGNERDHAVGRVGAGGVADAEDLVALFDEEVQHGILDVLIEENAEGWHEAVAASGGAPAAQTRFVFDGGGDVGVREIGVGATDCRRISTGLVEVPDSGRGDACPRKAPGIPEDVAMPDHLADVLTAALRQSNGFSFGVPRNFFDVNRQDRLSRGGGGQPIPRLRIAEDDMAPEDAEPKLGPGVGVIRVRLAEEGRRAPEVVQVDLMALTEERQRPQADNVSETVDAAIGHPWAGIDVRRGVDAGFFPVPEDALGEAGEPGDLLTGERQDTGHGFLSDGRNRPAHCPLRRATIPASPVPGPFAIRLRGQGAAAGIPFGGVGILG